MIDLVRYQDEAGRQPFEEWLLSIRDKATQARIRVRLRQLQAGNFGDCEPVGGGVIELRVHIGPGHRAYCGRHGRQVVVLLCGGTKATQDADIKRAMEYWSAWKRR